VHELPKKYRKTKKRKKISKEEIKRKHVIKRALERYGVLLTIRGCKRIANRVRKIDGQCSISCKDVVFVDRQSYRITRWFIYYYERWFPVVYDTKDKIIITILPKGSLGKEPPPLS